MTDAELTRFAAVLVRHLATVIGGERGYTAGTCPKCSSTRHAAQDVSPAYHAAAGERAYLDATAIPGGAGGACSMCQGGRRVWFRTRQGARGGISDRQLIAHAAEGDGARARGDRPNG
jgi:hypothetical protein